MAFWGIEVKPGKPITHSCEKARGRLRISQATLGIGEATKKTVVQCNVGNKSPVLLCALLPDTTESCHLDLEFAEADDVVFSVIGPRSVYLTGYYVSDSRHSDPHSDTESYGVDIENSQTEESNHHSDGDEEYEDSFIDDGELQVSPPSPVSSSNSMDESNLENDKPKGVKGRRRQLKKKYQVVESDNNDADAHESEDEDKYLSSFFKNKRAEKNKMSKTKESDALEALKVGDKAKANGVCSSKLKEEVGPQIVNGKADREGELTQVKNKKEAAASNDKVFTDGNIHENNAETNTNNQNIPMSDMNVQNDVTSGKQKRKIKEHSKKEEKTYEVNTDEDRNEVKTGQKSKKRKKEHKVDKTSKEEIVTTCNNTVPTDDKCVQGLLHVDSDMKDLRKASREDQQTDKEPEKKKKNKTKKKTQDASKATDETPTSKRTLSNGLSIEVLANGPPDGKVAAPGKKVKIYYTAMLKETGHIFDSNVGKTALKFRLGDKESIDRWNVGIDGMRVGEKRRLVIPPSLGFRDHEENVPPESWLVYDVELVGVRK